MYRLLIADDEMIERKVLFKTLSQNLKGQCEIFQAENGREALEIYEKEKIQIAILDIEMPGINGIQAAAVSYTHLGNLKGVKKICEDYGSRMSTFCTFDGSLEHLVDEAVGSNRCLLYTSCYHGKCKTVPDHEGKGSHLHEGRLHR